MRINFHTDIVSDGDFVISIVAFRFLAYENCCNLFYLQIGNLLERARVKFRAAQGQMSLGAIHFAIDLRSRLIVVQN
jgi:hypothetical protein